MEFRLQPGFGSHEQKTRLKPELHASPEVNEFHE